MFIAILIVAVVVSTGVFFVFHRRDPHQKELEAFVELGEALSSFDLRKMDRAGKKFVKAHNMCMAKAIVKMQEADKMFRELEEKLDEFNEEFDRLFSDDEADEKESEAFLQEITKKVV